MKSEQVFLFTILTLLALSPKSAFCGQTELEEDTCNQELVHSYRLFLKSAEQEDLPNYLYPYMNHDCCSFNSQKMIQVLWARISQPRLQRLLTANLSHIEVIIAHIKSILELFTRSELPERAKYSAECLESMDDMADLVSQNLAEKLDKTFEDVKVGFNTLYKFKKQFYYNICERDSHPFFDMFDKRIMFSTDFCSKLTEQFLDLSKFLNYKLVKYFKKIRNYVQCYSSRKYLLLQGTYDFEFRREELSDINECKKNGHCLNYCQRYSYAEIPEIFIGNKEHLYQMQFFLDHHIADNQGYFTTEPEYVAQYNQMIINKKMEIADDKNKQISTESLMPSTAASSCQNSNDENAKKLEFFQTGSSPSLDEARMEVYKKSFDYFRRRFIKKQMLKIRRKIYSEYKQNLEDMINNTFLTVSSAKINLVYYNTTIATKGLNPFDLLDKEDIYKINANLTLFSKEISNTVGELLYLNETSIIGKVMNTGLRMQADAQLKSAMSNVIRSKLFENSTETTTYLIANPSIDTGLSASVFGTRLFALSIAIICLIFNW